MPYTLSHPAAILPIRRLPYFTAAGLFIGAMSPDFEYILRLQPVSLYSHSLAGLFYFCVPVGLIVILLYRHLWIGPLSCFLPQNYLHSSRPPIWKEAISIIVGATTHIVWDAFTHGTRWGVTLFPLLGTRIALKKSYSIEAWHLLQYFSTTIGLLVVGVFIIRDAQRKDKSWFRRDGWKVIGAITIVSILSVSLARFCSHGIGIKSLLVNSANDFVASTAFVLTLSGLWRRWNRKTQRHL